MRDIKNRPFGARDKFGYMMGDFGCNMSFQLIGTYLMLFVTQGMGLSLVDWTIIVIIAKVFDAINDPIIGAMVDARKPSKNGKFRPWIFWSSFAVAISTALLFVDIRTFSHGGKFAYILIMYMLWSIAYTAVNVPYGSLNAALTDNQEQRTNLSSLRSIGAGIAMLPIMVVIPQLAYDKKIVIEQGIEKEVQIFKPEPFVWIAVVCGIVGIIGFMLTYFLTTERIVVHKPKEKFSYKETVKAFFHNKPVLALSLASFVQIVFILTYSATMPIVFQTYFKEAKMLSIATIITMLPMITLIPFMGKLSVKFGKKEISAWPCLLAIVVLFIMLFIPFERNRTGAWIFTILTAVAMYGGGAFTLATWSMVADCVDQQEINTGNREEGTVYATYSFVRKVAQGVGLGLIPLCLGAVGYNPNDMVASSTAEASNGILRLSILFQLIGFVLILFIMLFMYKLNKKQVAENLEYLHNLHKDMFDEENQSNYENEVSNQTIANQDMSLGAEEIIKESIEEQKKIDKANGTIENVETDEDDNSGENSTK